MPKPETRLRDWLVGGRRKRELLEVLLLERQPPGGWTESALARRAGMVAQGSVDVPLAVLGQLGVVERVGKTYRVVQGARLVAPLRRLLRALSEVEDRTIKSPSEWKRGS